jgi:hypothetical protein
MRAVFVVVGDVLGQDSFEVSTTEDQYSVQTFTPDGADEALGEGVGPGCPDRGADDPDVLRPKDLIETRSELGVSVPDQELDRMSPVSQHHAQVAGLLDNPRSSRVSRDPRHVHPAGVELDEEQHVEPLQQHRVDGEEVAGQCR